MKQKLWLYGVLLCGLLGCQSSVTLPPPPAQIAVPADLYQAPIAATTSLGELQRLAGAGNAHAQNELGRRYGLGEGVAKDSAQALHFYQLAAAQQLPIAQLNVGFMYYAGEAVAANKATAAQWFHAAALQGHYAAQYNLGRMYAVGEGVPQNGLLAEQWWLLAANQGHVDAQRALQQLFEQGIAVAKDSQKAKLWAQRVHQAEVTGMAWKLPPSQPN